MEEYLSDAVVTGINSFHEMATTLADFEYCSLPNKSTGGNSKARSDSIQ